ncbi:flagellar basal-body rod protein FlgF [Lachnospiraceae bacterium C1.1]|nr:flagellar basal-body rod protein FlgF [Lachnospiraceae bacterium C1.1]
MVKGLYTAYTGMINEQNRMDIMTNNLANLDTVGFKKEGSTSQAFGDILNYEIKDKSEFYLTKRMGTVNPGVRIGETYTDWEEGPLKETGNVYDLALSGNGFFNIEFTDKEGNTTTKYSRDGSFTLNADGTLVTEDGDFVLDTDGNHITVNPNIKTEINEEGEIWQGGANVATIAVTDFENYDYLEKYGENLYNTVDGATPIDADARVISGYLEQSNVNTVSEMVNMIAIQRQYESNQKVIKTMDGSLQIACNDLGKV